MARKKAQAQPDTNTTPQQVAPAEGEKLEDPVKRWKQEVLLAGKHFESWQTRGDKVVRRYRDERESEESGKRMFNLLWSNVQTLGPALYSRAPKVQVGRRFNDADKVGRLASMILERGVDYELEKYEISSVMRPAVQDRLLPGWGIAWVRYEPHFQTVTPAMPLTKAADFAAAQGVELSDETEYYAEGQPYGGKVEMRDGVPHGFGEPYQKKTWECTPTDYVFWKDFLMSPARVWGEVRWVGRRTFPSRAQLVKRFGEKTGNAIPLNAKPQGFGENDPAGKELQRAEVWEIWDRETKKVFWIAAGYDEFCDTRDDPLKLEGFFPCPKPLFATTTTDTMVPVPDYVEYQDQAKEIDDLTERIASLTKSLKVVGLFDKSVPELQRILNEGYENQMVGVDSWAAFAEKGGIKGAIDFLPITEVMETLTGLYSARQQVKNDCYEITGMADIVRGASNPNETATAQQIKGRYANLRLSDLQGDVERFARDLIRIKAEVMAENYSAETLIQISGIMQTPEFTNPPKELLAPPPIPPDTPPEMQQQAQMMAQQQMQAGLAKWKQDNQQLLSQAIALLKSPQFRDLRIDIETQSMIQMDQEGEKASRSEFLVSVAGFLQQAGQMLQIAPQSAELMAEMLRFAVRSFPVGREMESTIDRFIESMAGAPQQDPKAAQEKQSVAAERAKVDAEKQAIPLHKQLAEKDIENTTLKSQMRIKDASHAVIDEVKGLIEQHSQHVAKVVQAAKESPVDVEGEVAKSHRELMAQVQSLVTAMQGQGQPA